MAQRRMISLKIVDSAKFIKMPVSSRTLYYDLIIRADDDGVVEAFNVMRITGATEDDLRVLVSKGFVIILNEDLVSFITDWLEHNKIRADRKIDSLYKDLLLQVVSDVELVNKRTRSDCKKLIGQPMDMQWTDNGQPMDSIGKDRLGKDRETTTVVVSSEIEKVKQLLKDLQLTDLEALKILKSSKGDFEVIQKVYNHFKNKKVDNFVGIMISMVKPGAFEKPKHNVTKDSFNDYDGQRHYDFDKLEKQLLGIDD